MSGIVPDNKGGGLHGGPRRWTGKGPRPARHIPWPELFKHHQSVLTGHLKMMDMVRKYCVEGSGNYITAQACVDRTHEMLRMFKQTVNSFVPPRDNIDRVPLGASSASMYPGYSPADHIYGEAAAEYGKRIAEAKRHGIEVKTDNEGLEYIVGQNTKSAREQIEAIRRDRAPAKAGNKSDRFTNPTTPEKTDIKEGEPMEDVEETGDGADLFMVDSNPTPVAQLQGKPTVIRTKNKANDKAKRRVSSQDEEEQSNPSGSVAHKKKKVKTSKAIDVPYEADPTTAKDEFEQAVEARIKEKEDKRKKKEEKKRKRESDSSQMAQSQSPNLVKRANVPVEEPTSDKQRKHKIAKNAAVATISNANDSGEKVENQQSSNAPGVADHPIEGGEKRKKKKQKKVASN